MLLDAPEYLGTIDLAQHDVLPTHPGDGVGHAPAVAMEHRKRVEVHVAVVHSGLPSERGRVDPDVAVRHLDALRTRRRATRVIDGGSRVLVRLAPRLGLDALHEQLLVGLGADHEPVLGLHVAERVVELGIDEQHRGTGVLDDVAHLVGIQPEVDRHEHPAVTTHSPERRQETSRVLGDHGDPLALADPEAVEAGGLRPRQLGKARVREVTPRGGGLVGLVDHTCARAVDQLGSAEEVGNRQRNLHQSTPTRSAEGREPTPGGFRVDCVPQVRYPLLVMSQKKRTSRPSSSKKSAKRLRRKAVAVLRSARSTARFELAAAEAAATEIRDQARTSAEAECSELRAEAHRESAQIRTDARNDARKEATLILEQARSQADAIATERRATADAEARAVVAEGALEAARVLADAEARGAGDTRRWSRRAGTGARQCRRGAGPVAGRGERGGRPNPLGLDRRGRDVRASPRRRATRDRREVTGRGGEDPRRGPIGREGAGRDRGGSQGQAAHSAVAGCRSPTHRGGKCRACRVVAE